MARRTNNKEEREIANKKAHFERQKPVLERLEPTLSEPARMLIVCEGENTEVDYFNRLNPSCVVFI